MQWLMTWIVRRQLRHVGVVANVADLHGVPQGMQPGTPWITAPGFGHTILKGSIFHGYVTMSSYQRVMLIWKFSMRHLPFPNLTHQEVAAPPLRNMFPRVASCGKSYLWIQKETYKPYHLCNLIINLPFGDGSYHLFVVISRVVYCWVYHSKSKINTAVNPIIGHSPV